MTEAEIGVDTGLTYFEVKYGVVDVLDSARLFPMSASSTVNDLPLAQNLIYYYSDALTSRVFNCARLLLCQLLRRPHEGVFFP